MVDEVNILIFPAGSESAMDIYESLRYNLHFNVYGASGRSDHAEFVYPEDRLIIEDLYIKNEDFFTKFNGLIDRFDIDLIIPTHDTVKMFLGKNKERIRAKVVGSPHETAVIAENKKLTFDALKGNSFMPDVFENVEEIERYPVFAKPFVGAGSKGTHLVKDREMLENILKSNSDMLICEYLPGKEYTVDCFTNKKGELLFAGPRIRERITIGITFHSEKVDYSEEFEYIAKQLNETFDIRGAWFFQVKEDISGKLKFMEFAVRQAGTMAFYRQLGVNFAALTVFDEMGYDVEILLNDNKLILDRSLKCNYHLDHEYERVYVDFDDTLIIEEKVNSNLMKLIYQSKNLDKQIILLTKHGKDIYESLTRYHIDRGIFDKIIHIEPEAEKADHIEGPGAIFIDNYFKERRSVKEKCDIPVFDVDAVECLIDPRYL